MTAAGMLSVDYSEITHCLASTLLTLLEETREELLETNKKKKEKVDEGVEIERTLRERNAYLLCSCSEGKECAR